MSRTNHSRLASAAWLMKICFFSPGLPLQDSCHKDRDNNWSYHRFPTVATWKDISGPHSAAAGISFIEWWLNLVIVSFSMLITILLKRVSQTMKIPIVSNNTPSCLIWGPARKRLASKNACFTFTCLANRGQQHYHMDNENMGKFCLHESGWVVGGCHSSHGDKVLRIFLPLKSSRRRVWWV